MSSSPSQCFLSWLEVKHIWSFHFFFFLFFVVWLYAQRVTTPPRLPVYPSFLFSNIQIQTWQNKSFWLTSAVSSVHTSSRGKELSFPGGTHTHLGLAGGRRLGVVIKITLCHCKAIPVSPLCLLNVTPSRPACQFLHILTFLQLVSSSLLTMFVREDAGNAPQHLELPWFIYFTTFWHLID